MENINNATLWSKRVRVSVEGMNPFLLGSFINVDNSSLADNHESFLHAQSCDHDCQ